MHLNGTAWVISSSSLSSSSLNWSPLSALSPSFPLSALSHSLPDQVQDQPTTQIDLFLQNHNKKIFILLLYTYTVISKISNLMQKCLTIYSNIRTTHKYGNYLQMKIEKYITTVCTYICKNLSTTRYKQASYFSKNLLNNLFNSKHVHNVSQ